MRVIIYGHKGWIGKKFVEILKSNNIDYILGNARVDNDIELRREITVSCASNVIAFIGRTHGPGYNTIDYLEQPGKLFDNVRDNMYAPLNLAIICESLNVHYTYIGTGCIFTYDENHTLNEGLQGLQGLQGFTESDIPNFTGSSYSIVKGFTDRIMHHYKNVLNLRIRMPITSVDEPRNFISKIIRYSKICSVPNSMTVLDDMLPVMLDMMRKNITGTFNMTNPGLISHNEILELYCKLVDNNFTWTNFDEEEQNKILDSKRSNNYLDTSKLTQHYPDIPHIKDSVKIIMEKWNKKVCNY